MNICPHCGMPLPEPPPPPEATEAIRQMIARTAEIIGAEIDTDEEKGVTGIALATLSLVIASTLLALKDDQYAQA